MRSVLLNRLRGSRPCLVRGAVLLVLSGGFLSGGTAAQNGAVGSPTAESKVDTTLAFLPDAPGPWGSDATLAGVNGGPESSNAPPQFRQTIQDQSDDQQNPAFFSDHLIRGRFWISGQLNLIFQAHTPFHSPYSGDNSFHGYGEHALSRTLTLYTGVRLLRFSELIASIDEAGGRGLSDAHGIAAYPNADVIDPDISRAVYVSRCFLHRTVALTAERINEQPNPLFLQPSIPRHRLEAAFGKFNLLDFFDVNEVGADSHLQFTNIAIGNNGIYENPSDAHGDTIASMVSYQGPKFAIRFAEALLPRVSTGTDLDYDFQHTHSDNLEVDYTTYRLQGYASHVRALVYASHADLGNYREANEAFLAGRESQPEIGRHRHPGTVKRGYGINLEQDLPGNFRAFLRAGWNNGRYESFAFSEMNNTVSLGVDLAGDAWRRKEDRIGSAFVNSGLGADHREYLALGGIGFMLGDGGLRYGRETVSETYYTAHVTGGLYLAAQISFVNNPGFNRDRGPVIVPGLRAHVDF